MKIYEKYPDDYITTETEWEAGYQKGLVDGYNKRIQEEQQKVPAVDRCPKCGVNMSGTMGYVCRSPNCPVFPNITC